MRRPETGVTCTVGVDLQFIDRVPYLAREGVIIEWPLNDLFNNGGDVIISLQMGVISFFDDTF